MTSGTRAYCPADSLSVELKGAFSSWSNENAPLTGPASLSPSAVDAKQRARRMKRAVMDMQTLLGRAALGQCGAAYRPGPLQVILVPIGLLILVDQNEDVVRPFLWDRSSKMNVPSVEKGKLQP